MKHIALNAHLLSKTAGYRKAGIHRYMYGVLQNLHAVDDGDFHYTAFANHTIEGDMPRFDSQISALDTANPAKRIAWEQFVQPFAIRRTQPDLYHAMAFVSPWHINIPNVVTVYDLSFIHYPEVLTRARRMYLQNFTRHTCQQATRVIAISQSTAHDLSDMMDIPPEKIDIAVPGVSNQFKPLATKDIEAFRKKKKLPQRFMLFVGTLEPRKNLTTLIKAYGQLPEALRQEMHLVIGGGKGWFYEEIFATISQLGLENTVHTPGYIPADELVAWYNAASVFVYPALFEGFGIPIIEAYACGTPVITSNASSLPEAAGDHGILLPPKDIDAWAHALRNAIEDQENQSVGQAQRVAWAQTFTWQQTARQTVESYRKALG